VPALTVAAGAGFTTTSSLLSWLLYGLVAYDGMQARLLQELVDHDFADDTEVTPELLEDLPELDKFIKEMQRRHNPSYQPGRTAQRDLILPGGYKVKKGTVIIVALHHIHMNPKIWFVPTLLGSMPLKHPTNNNRVGTTPKSSTQTDGTQTK
jgi:cytochrome P450